MVKKKDLEVIEVLLFMGEKRYRVKIKDTNIVFNVHAENSDEAIEKTLELIQKVGLTEEALAKLRGENRENIG